MSHQRLKLYRSLLSLIKAPRSEAEVVHFVVDTVHEHFPEYRTTFSRFEDESKVNILYSRQREELPSLSGKTINLSGVPDLLAAFRRGEVAVIKDLNAIPYLAPHVPKLLAFGGNISRLDIPFTESDGVIALLSLTSEVPVDWSHETVDLMREISELIDLMLREARTRDRLSRTEALFHEFAENVQVVFWMTDTTKNDMVYVSPAYENIWGRSVDSLYREPWSFLEAVHPDDRARVRAAVERQADATYEQIYRVVQPGGSVRWVKDRGFRVRDEKGHAVRIVGIAEDITALREAQDRLEATQAQVVSNAKFAALGEMASGMAHEINNPLAVIHGLTVQLQELFHNQNASVPMVLDSLGSMEKMSNRIAAIVKGLRTFSRQTDGDPMTPSDLNGIVQETMAMCEAKLRAADIHVTVNVPMSRVLVKCRSSEISQVLLNLVSNAYDAVVAVPERTVLIEVRAMTGFAQIAVHDSGDGIDPSFRDRVFQPFFTTKEVGRGTGLGLSISKGIVEAHGGTLFLDTASPKTRFVVELPTA